MTIRATISLVVAATLVVCAAPARAQWTFEGSAVGGRLAHRVDAGYGVAGSTGTVIGAATQITGWEVLEFDVRALGGRLEGDTVAGGDRRVGEIGARGSMLALPWLAFTGRAALRAYETSAATQRWTSAGAGAEVRLAFAGGQLRSVVRTTVLPYVRVSGQPAPDLGIDSGAGLQLSVGRILAGVDYSLERYVFPSDPVGGRRREQLSGLLLRVGGRW